MDKAGKNRKQLYGVFYRIARFFARLFLWISDIPPEHPEPCVYVCRHKNMQGPMYIAANYQVRYRIWVLSVFLSREECFRQYYGYTFTKLYGWPRAFAYVVARLASYVIPALMKSMRAVAVYRGSASVIKTYRESVSALIAGDSLMIFPDIDYKSEGNDLVEFYDGFLLLGRYYQAKTGKPIAFVPLYVDDERRRILKGAPVSFMAGERTSASASKDVMNELIHAIDELSRSE